jgi:hypothetical protein
MTRTESLRTGWILDARRDQLERQRDRWRAGWETPTRAKPQRRRRPRRTSRWGWASEFTGVYGKPGSRR